MSFIPIPIRDNLVHFIGKQGCTWSCNVTLLQYGTTNPIDLTGYSVRGQIRKSYADAEPTAVFTCTIIEAAEGKINIQLGAEETASFTACKNEVDSTNYESADRNGRYVYDVEIYKGDPEVVYRVIQGILYVDAEVTKP